MGLFRKKDTRRANRRRAIEAIKKLEAVMNPAIAESVLEMQLQKVCGAAREESESILDTAARAFSLTGEQLRAAIIAVVVDGEDPKKLVGGQKVEPVSAFYATFAALYICLLRERAAERKAS